MAGTSRPASPAAARARGAHQGILPGGGDSPRPDALSGPGPAFAGAAPRHYLGKDAKPADQRTGIRDQGSELPQLPETVVVIAAVARQDGASLADNPYPEGSGRWLIWRHGWQTRDRARGETSHVKQSRRGCGPDWTAGEIEALRLCTGLFRDAQIAELVGHSARAVRIKRCRLRSEGPL